LENIRYSLFLSLYLYLSDDVYITLQNFIAAEYFITHCQRYILHDSSDVSCTYPPGHYIHICFLLSLFHTNFSYCNEGEVFIDVITNVMVDWMTLLLRVREVPGSNLRMETTILTEVFRGFLSNSRKTWDKVK
jgi:hypothetical protein